MTSPSTDWKEAIAPGESELFEKLAADLGGMQQGLGKSRGLKRALHAKPNFVVRASFEVKGDLPQTHRVGLFAEPKTYEAVARFSNGGPAALGDKKPDVRGIGVKVLGVGGKKLIPGMESAPTQDFLAILSSTMPFVSPEQFVWFVLAARSPLTLLPKAIFKFGLGPTLKLVSELQKGLGAPLTSLHTNRYFSNLPIRFGPYAAKFCFTPQGPQNVVTKADDLGAELAQHVAAHDSKWDFQVQLFTDEKSTPIELTGVEWNSPWTTLATLTVPKQSPTAAFTEWAEQLSFDPWHAQEELRPLGAMMRARSAAYRVSTQNRSAAPEPSELPR